MRLSPIIPARFILKKTAKSVFFSGAGIFHICPDMEAAPFAGHFNNT